MRRAVLCLLTVVLIVLVGCRGRGSTPAGEAMPTLTPTAARSPSPTSIPTPTASPLATPTPTSSPRPTPTTTPTPQPSPWLGVARQGGKLGRVWTLVDVRYGLHPDRLRVVWEMNESGEGVPLYEAVEVDNAADPSPTGHDPAWGAARIDLVVSDVYAYDFPLGQHLPLVPPDNPVVTRIGLYPTYSDAHLGFSIGLKSPAAYEVYELTNPVRIVIDVLYGK